LSRLNYYHILGISKTATNDEIKNAFRKLALKYHPDRNKEIESHKRFIEISEAKELLLDSEKRNVYDYEYFDGESFKEKTESYSDDYSESYQDFSQSYYEENTDELIDDDGNNFEELSDKIRERVCKTLDMFFEIICVFCSKIIKFDLTKEHNSHFIKDTITDYYFSIHDCFAEIGSLTRTDYVFDYEYIIDEDKIEPFFHQKSHELKYFEKKILTLIKGYGGGRKSRPIREKWIKESFHSQKNYNIEDYSKKIRGNVGYEIEKTIIEYFKILNEHKTKGKDSFRYMSVGYAVPIEQIPEGAIQDIPYGNNIPKSTIPDIYQRIMLEILLHVNSISKIMELLCLSVEKNIETFQKTKFSK
jgi:curved DNA-binding protein CbpA